MQEDVLFQNQNLHCSGAQFSQCFQQPQEYTRTNQPFPQVILYKTPLFQISFFQGRQQSFPSEYTSKRPDILRPLFSDNVYHLLQQYPRPFPATA